MKSAPRSRFRLLRSRGRGFVVALRQDLLDKRWRGKMNPVRNRRTPCRRPEKAHACRQVASQSYGSPAYLSTIRWRHEDICASVEDIALPWRPLRTPGWILGTLLMKTQFRGLPTKLPTATPVRMTGVAWARKPMKPWFRHILRLLKTGPSERWCSWLMCSGWR